MAELQTTHYLAGMPQLAYAGLSEHWLLKECGQHHWSGTARAHGLVLPRFCDTSGRTAYAAFTAIHLTMARLDAVAEHHPFSIDSLVRGASRSQYYSRHQVQAGDGAVAQVEMLSAFVQRLEPGNNQSVVRAIPGAPAAMDEATAGERQAIDKLLTEGRRLRQAETARCMELQRGGGAPLRRMAFAPCPNSDFNGANFMYFATFQAMVERAEWSWFRRRDLPQLEQRRLYFHGNVNVGDDVEVQLLDLHDDGAALHHWCGIVRGSDGARIADVITLKRGATSKDQR